VAGNAGPPTFGVSLDKSTAITQYRHHCHTLPSARAEAARMSRPVAALALIIAGALSSVVRVVRRVTGSQSGH
jgi:hypothetical protein